MASVHASHESGDVSESSPLLQNGDQTAAGLSTPTPIPSSVKNRVTALLCAFSFFLMLGDNLQPAALIQVYENAICESYFKDHTPSSTPVDCKIPEIQKELALVRGFQQFVPIFAAVFCTIPYGLLAQRVGRKPILILSGAGLFLQLAWALLVCYLRSIPIRWVWLSGIFLFVGGGDAVAATVSHVIVTDAIDEADRAQIFLYLHAADVVSGFFGPAISAPLMENGYTWAVLLLALGILFSCSFVLPVFLPETLNLQEQHAEAPRLAVHGVSEEDPNPSHQYDSPLKVPNGQVASLTADLRDLVMPLFQVLFTNRQALLLLCVFAPQTAARELFNTVGLQFSSAKFSLDYSHGNSLLSLFQGMQGVFVLGLLPTLTRFIAVPRRWSAWARDRRYAITSIAVTAVGLLIIATAPAVPFMAAGLLVVALGSCTNGLLMSLLGAAVEKAEIPAVYSVAPMLSLVMRSFTAPVVNTLLIAGLDLGGVWIGLPFGVVGILMLGVMIVSLFISAERQADQIEDLTVGRNETSLSSERSAVRCQS